MASSDQQTKKFWLEHIEHWQSSGLSQAAYCQHHGLVAHQFSYWKRKLVTVEIPSSNTPSPAFACVQVEATVTFRRTETLTFQSIPQTFRV